MVDVSVVTVFRGLGLAKATDMLSGTNKAELVTSEENTEMAIVKEHFICDSGLGTVIGFRGWHTGTDRQKMSYHRGTGTWGCSKRL